MGSRTQTVGSPAIRRPRRIVIMGVFGAVGTLLLAVPLWFVWSGDPYPTPQAAASAYVGSVEHHTNGTLTGTVASVFMEGDTAQVVVDWTGSHSRQQILAVTKTTSWAGVRSGWAVRSTGTAKTAAVESG